MTTHNNRYDDHSAFRQLRHITIEEKVVDEDLIFADELLADGEWKTIQNRIIFIGNDNANLEIKIGVTSLDLDYSNCYVDIEDDNLRIGFESKNSTQPIENFTTYREIILKITGLNTVPKEFTFEGKKIVVSNEKYNVFKEKFEIIGKDTINRYDKYGERQGLWKTKHQNSEVERHYVDSKLIKAEIRSYFKSGEIEWQYFKNDQTSPKRVSYRSYFETGEIKEEDYVLHKSEGIFKTKWYKTGVISQENSYDGEQITISQFKNNGELNCECKTQIGVDYFKGWISSYHSNKIKILCTYFDSKGKEESRRENEFNLYYDIVPR